MGNAAVNPNRWKAWLILTALVGATFPLGARGQVPGQTAGVIVRDSAGVKIVENTGPRWSSTTGWRIADRAALQIGSRSGADGPAFGRIGDAIRLEDGRFVVTDPMARQVHFLNRGGRFLALAGRTGDGPSEFRQMGSLWLLRGDTIAVEEPQAGKMVCFDDAGTHAQTVMTPGRGWNGELAPSVVAVLPDASFFVTTLPQKWQYPPGKDVTFAPLYFFDSDNVFQGLVDSLPAFHTVNEGRIQEDVVLGPRRHFASDETGVWFGFSQTYELLHITSEGVDKIIRRPAEREAVSQRIRDQWLEWRKSAFREPVPDFVWEVLEREPVADSLPAFNQIKVSRDGHLWVEDPYSASEQTPETWEMGIPSGQSPWSVFDPTGAWLGTVMMPGGLRVTEIGPDYVLGVWKDEWDVSYLRYYQVIKPYP